MTLLLESRGESIALQRGIFSGVQPVARVALAMRGRTHRRMVRSRVWRRTRATTQAIRYRS
jgi:hypothetical protein